VATVTDEGEAAGASVSSVRSERDILAAAKGAGFLAGGTFFELTARFLIAILLARFLGTRDYGLYVLSVSAGAMFAGISLLGLDDAMVRYVAILSGRRDHRGLWGTLQIGLGVSTAAALLLGTCLFIAAGPVAEGLFHEPRLTPVLRLFAVIVPFLTVSNVLLGTARGFHRMDYGAFAQNVVQTLVRAGLLGVLALLGRLDLYAAAVVFGISDLAASVTLIVLLNRRFPLRGTLQADVRRPVREVFRFAFPLWLSGLLRQFRRNIEIVMLGALSGVSNVGIFAVASRVNLVGHVSLQSTLIAVKPSLAQLHARHDRDGLARLYTAATRWTFTLNVPFFLIIVLFPEPILRLFGESFTAGTVALLVLACAELVNAATGICGSMIDMTGHTRVKLANSIVWTVLLIGGSAVLIPAWGVFGAAAATFVAIATVNLASVVEMWVLEQVVPFDRTFLKPLAAGLGALACGMGLKAWAPLGDALWPAFLQAAIVGATYVSLVLLLRLAPDDRLVVDRVLKRVGLVPARRSVT
jgi:O-antigen/teichoic acid export membrane protein